MRVHMCVRIACVCLCVNVVCVCVGGGGCVGVGVFCRHLCEEKQRKF